MKPFHEVHTSDLSRDLLCEQIDSKGYVLIRDLLPLDNLMQLLDEITKKLSTAGWLLPGHNPLDRFADTSAACGDPDPLFKRTYQEIFNLELFHALPHHPALRQIMNMIVGKQLLVHPKPIGRLIFPHCDRLTVHAHQDYRFMGGDTECYTTWIPLHNCPTDIGPLQEAERGGYGSTIARACGCVRSTPPCLVLRLCECEDARWKDGANVKPDR